MTKELWINLPVKDIKRSREFFRNIGFNFNTQHPENDQSVSLVIGSKNIIVMLFREDIFKGFIQHDVTDTAVSSEMLISIDAESPEEVDAIAEKVSASGGIIFGKPSAIQGWMYGCGFTDPDGHRWNVLHMDLSKMPEH
ncbi:MAG TPA: VOC family protein [Bacteroidia bacterium]|jgi:hypothetical protein